MILKSLILASASTAFGTDRQISLRSLAESAAHPMFAHRIMTAAARLFASHLAATRIIARASQAMCRWIRDVRVEVRMFFKMRSFAAAASRHLRAKKKHDLCAVDVFSMRTSKRLRRQKAQPLLKSRPLPSRAKRRPSLYVSSPIIVQSSH